MLQLQVPAAVRTAATAEEAARAFAAALRETGGSDVLLWDPATDREQTDQGVWRVVWEGSGDPEWGVRLSLHQSAMGCRWGYLEPHHGFDVGFVEQGR